MIKNDFIKFCNPIFKANGFVKNGTVHFYKDLGDDIMLVIGLQHSAYDSLYWFEGGFVIKSINKNMPYPKFSYVNIRIPLKIGIGDQYHINYTKIDEEETEQLKQSIQNVIDYYSSCDSKDALIDKVIAPEAYTYCSDYDMQNYFGGIIPPKKLLPDPSQVEQPKKELKTATGLKITVNLMAENGRQSGAVDIILELGKKLGFLCSPETVEENAKKYGSEFEKIQINPYCASVATLQKLGWKEKKLVSHSKKSADIRLLINYERFMSETYENRRLLVIDIILKSIQVIGEKSKTEFKTDVLTEDILNALNIEKMI